MADARKTIHELKVEHDKYRGFCGRVYAHKKSGEKYHLLFPSFDEATNDVMATYSLCSMPWLKFTRPFDVFLDRFEESH